MKEITRVHLAKTPFSIELDAKKDLEKYLLAIEKKMHADAEAMREIEARMVELLAERGVQKDQVISAIDVKDLQEQMGNPGDFSESSEDGDVYIDESSDQPQKRMMRDRDGAVLGGVCSGVAQYFGIDVVWVRLAAILLVIVSAGMAILFYALAWLLTPPAVTTADKLQLRGKAVTLDALKKFAASEEVRERTTSVGVKFLQILLGAAGILVAVGAFVATVVGGFLGFSVILLFEGFQAQLWAWGLLASLVIGGIATVCLALLITRSAFTWRTGKVSSAAMIAMLSVGAVCLSSTILFGIQTKQTFVQDEVTHTKVVPVSLPKNLEGIKYADSENATLSYDSRGSAVRAEVKYMVLKGFSEPKIDVKRDGDRLTFSASRNNNEPCISSWILGYSGCINPFAQVTVYGPVDWVNYGNDTPDIDPVHIPEHLEN